LIVTNFGADAVELPADLVAGRSLILASQPDATRQLLPSDSCSWLSPAH
jgi:hypothetical protein